MTCLWSSINDVTVLGWRGKGICDDSTFVIKRITMKEEVKNFFFFLNIFLVWLAPFSCLYFFGIFSPIKWSFHLVFRQGQDSNPRPRTMARIVNPRHSPLDQGASLALSDFNVTGMFRFRVITEISTENKPQNSSNAEAVWDACGNY